MVVTKNQYRGEDFLKKGGGLGQFANLRGGGGVGIKEGGCVFEGEDACYEFSLGLHVI